MQKSSTRNIVFTGLFIALGIILPYFTGHIQAWGSALLPMHIPVLLAGFVCGWPYGLVTGLVTPFLSSFLTSMPPVPVALVMTFELAAYGFMAGLMYKILPKKNGSVYWALIIAMLAGRVVWGLASLLITGLKGGAFTLQMFMAGGFINAWAGILIQLVIIPVIIIALGRAGYMRDSGHRTHGV
ncbi:MAG: ECF transporter S component [Clostridiales bacterium]|nr:ECF transporter S component [Clostridiales bacterium]